MIILPQASEPLGTFLDYCTYGHMIDNIVLIVTGTLHERDVQVREGRRLACSRGEGVRLHLLPSLALLGHRSALCSHQMI